MQLAELAAMQGNTAEVQFHYDQAEAAYNESLHAVVCDVPENDVMREHWERNHRHWSAEMFENLGNTRFVRGHLPEAVKAYRMSLWIDKTNTRVLKNLASVYGRMGRQQDALQIWLQIRSLNPQDPDLQRVFHGNTPPTRPS